MHFKFELVEYNYAVCSYLNLFSFCITGFEPILRLSTLQYLLVACRTLLLLRRMHRCNFHRFSFSTAYAAETGYFNLFPSIQNFISFHIYSRITQSTDILVGHLSCV